MFDEKDLKFHKGLMMLLDDATFTLKAKEIGSFTAIYNWAATLPQQQKQKQIPPVKTGGVDSTSKKKTVKKTNSKGTK